MKFKKIIITALYLFFILLTINNTCWAAPHDLGTLEGLKTGYEPTLEANASGNAPDVFESIMSNIVGFLTILSGLYFFVMFIIGGLGWASAGGDSGKVDTAKNRMTNGVIGLIIVVAAYSVIFIVGTVLGIKILQPGEEIIKLSPNYTP